MNFFNDNDPFESIVREFFGSPVRRKERETIIQGEGEDRVIDFIESKDKIYLIFELPGFDEKDITVLIKGREIEIKAQKRSDENIQQYLTQKLRREFFIRKTLPNFINPKKFSYTMKNGILEVIFEKRKWGAKE